MKAETHAYTVIWGHFRGGRMYSRDVESLNEVVYQLTYRQSLGFAYVDFFLVEEPCVNATSYRTRTVA